MSGRDVAKRIWDQQSVWSQAANAAKRQIDRSRLAALLLTILAALLGTLSTAVGAEVAPGRWLAAGAGLCAGLVAVLQRFWTAEHFQAWARLRSVSEAFKSDVYLWLADAGDFIGDTSAATLRDRTDRVALEAADLLPRRLHLTPVPRELPPVTDGATYFQTRVASQINAYYRPKADQQASRLKLLRRVQLAMAILAALLGFAAAGSTTDLGIWIAVTATVGTAVALHVASTRYEYSLLEFLRTAQELERLLDKAERQSDADEVRKLAVTAEAAISVENQAWMVKMSEARVTPA